LPAKQGEYQEYMDVLSLYRQYLQNKRCFHNQIYAYLSTARNTQVLHKVGMEIFLAKEVAVH
jgi:hypothetical protein